jgi:soluble lytic murein transglycosylase-like protein
MTNLKKRQIVAILLFLVFMISMAVNISLPSGGSVIAEAEAMEPTAARVVQTIQPPATATAAAPAKVMLQSTATPHPTVMPERCSVSPNFPKKVYRWCGLITQYAAEFTVSPDLVASIILQESGGNPDAYSKAGATGLMQVMPRDGKAASFICSGSPCFKKRPTMAELKDPAFNIKYGTQMIAGLTRKCGNVRDALKYYGPSGCGYYYADIVLKHYNKYHK